MRHAPLKSTSPTVSSAAEQPVATKQQGGLVLAGVIGASNWLMLSLEINVEQLLLG